MYDLPVNAIKAFAAVYETDGVRAAARVLDVAHSSVSRHLAELEKWLGISLLERPKSSRQLKFTPQGELLGRAALDSLGALAAVIQSLREAPQRNAVAISTAPSFASLWLLPRLSSFQRAYPWIELSVIAEQNIADPSDQLADLAIRMGKGPWRSLLCESLMDEELYPVMSRTLWEKSGRPDNPDDLAQLRLLHDRDPNAPWSAWLAVHCSKRIDTRSGPRYGSSDLVLRAAAQGLGVALARGRLAANDVATGVLVKPFGERHVKIPDAYWLVRANERNTPVAIPPVIDWLKRQARTPLPEIPSTEDQAG